MVDYVGKLASALREHMKTDFTKRLQGTLEQMKWPSKDLYLPDDLRAQWGEHVELLLDLQTPCVSSPRFLIGCTNILRTSELQNRDVSNEKNVKPPILLPLDVMVRPLELRFKYHFSGDRPTNRLDKVLCINQRKENIYLTELEARVLPCSCHGLDQQLQRFFRFIPAAYL
jgi:hypothetical protein